MYTIDPVVGMYLTVFLIGFCLAIIIYTIWNMTIDAVCDD